MRNKQEAEWEKKRLSQKNKRSWKISKDYVCFCVGQKVKMSLVYFTWNDLLFPYRLYSYSYIILCTYTYIKTQKNCL